MTVILRREKLMSKVSENYISKNPKIIVVIKEKKFKNMKI